MRPTSSLISATSESSTTGSFLDIDKLDNIDEALVSGNIEKEAAIGESLIQKDSPYPEVRASVRYTRSSTLPVPKNVSETMSPSLREL